MIPLKHSGNNDEDNMSVSCMKCNRRKGSDFATIDSETKEIIRLFNPREDQWDEHFQLEGVKIVPITKEGRATVFVLKLNDE